MMKLAISHFAVEPPRPNQLIPLSCFCRVYDGSSEKIYIEGMNLDRRYTSDEMDELEKLGQILPLPIQHTKDEGNGLFLDSYGYVFLLPKKNQLEPNSRIIVHKLPQHLLDSAIIPDSPQLLEMKLLGKSITDKIKYLFQPLLDDSSIDKLYLEAMQKILLQEFLELESENITMRKTLSFVKDNSTELENSILLKILDAIRNYARESQDSTLSRLLTQEDDNIT